MNIQPGFLDHPKTLALTRKLGKPDSPLYVMRLWEFCQQRRTCVFATMDADTLAAVCRWPGDPKIFFKAMKTAGFIDVEGKKITAHGWKDANGKLIAAWENGSKHVPSQDPMGDPQDTRRVPKPDHKNQINKKEPDLTKPNEPREPIEQAEPSNGSGVSFPSSGSVGRSVGMDEESALKFFKENACTGADAIRFAITNNPRGAVNAPDINAAMSCRPDGELLTIAAKVYAARSNGKPKNREAFAVGIIRNLLKEEAR